MLIRPNQTELRLYQRMFYESASMLGLSIIYHQVDTLKANRDTPDVEYTYLDPVGLPVIFDTEPSPKMLEKYGWNMEDDADGPYIMNMPVFYKNSNNQEVDLVITKDSIVELLYDEIYQFKKFSVKAVQRHIDSRYYIVNLTPYRRTGEVQELNRNRTFINDYEDEIKLSDKPATQQTAQKKRQFLNAD